MKIKATSVFEQNYNEYVREETKIIINQGGSRSSKTYSILQLLIIEALRKRQLITIVRKSFPSLRGSVMRDWRDIMLELNIYDENKHSKTENLYRFENGSVIEFISLDDPQKVRGRKRDILYINEANEIDFESWIQLKLRTTGKVFLDYNPSDHEHWVYNLLNKKGSVLIKSTYKDNPFLTEDQVKYIENLIDIDYNYYLIYTLGEKPISNSRIYTHFKEYSHIPNPDYIVYGLDFGFNDPSVLVKIQFEGDKIYVEECLYESKLTSPELISKIKDIIKNDAVIYCDTARPEIIEDMRRSGLNAQGAVKDVKEGIDMIKSNRIFVEINSKNIWREFKLYSWKVDKSGKILDIVQDGNDHAMDAIRYAVYSFRKNYNPFNIDFFQVY